MPGIHRPRREIRPAPPFRETEFDIAYGKRISQSGELLDLATNHDIVEKSGAWYSYGSDRLGQGREAVEHFIEENPDIAQRITVAVRENLGFAPKEAKEA
ncbi:MAG: hypothetical protein NT002_01405 [candidate division Zixibacteria bacterium]|nr:hypothetical protein [candidate division Zixibacteria bacterium]